MFELFFKYPSAVFSKGTFVLLGGWPVWLLLIAIVVAAVGLAVLIRKRSTGSVRMAGIRSAMVWLLQTALAAVLLLMLWHPALSVATLRPHGDCRGGEQHRRGRIVHGEPVHERRQLVL